jgi:hypothetical protein
LLVEVYLSLGSGDIPAITSFSDFTIMGGIIKQYGLGAICSGFNVGIRVEVSEAEENGDWSYGVYFPLNHIR